MDFAISADFEKFDILGVVSEMAIRQYMLYGESSFQIYNDVDRAFCESINRAGGSSMNDEVHQ